MNDLSESDAGMPLAVTKKEYGIYNSTPLEKARRGILFEKDGLYGLKDNDGVITFPAVYSFIGRCRDHVLFLKPDGEYVKISNACMESGLMPQDERPYVKNGKAGFKIGRKVIIPAEYEYIQCKFGKTVFLAVRDGREMYLDDKGREVLTRVRRFEGEAETTSPFWLCSDRLDFITAMDYAGSPREDNPNIVQIGDCWVELERYCKKEIVGMFVNPEDDLPMTEEDLKMLNNPFSYEYSVYFANARGHNKFEECINQFRRMNVFSNSWYYIVKIWLAPGQNPDTQTLRSFIDKIESEMSSKGILGSPVYAIGHSSNLESDEVRMLMITHYNERCWPSSCELEWYDKCYSLPIVKLRDEIPALKEDIKDEIISLYQDEVFKDLVRDCIKELEYYPEQSWEDAESALEYFLGIGSSLKNALVSYLEKVIEIVQDVECESHATFFLKAAKWILSKSDNVNERSSDRCSTALDLLIQISSFQIPENFSVMIEELRETMLAKGAKTGNELNEERSSNRDYFKELETLRKMRANENQDTN